MLLLSILQMGSGLLLVAAIILQNRGTGLSAAFGGSGNIYRTKRGIERVLFHSTIVLAVVFFGSSLFAVIVQ